MAVPVDVKRRIQVLAIDELDGTASVEVAFAVAPQFGLAKDEAQIIAGDVGTAVSKWRHVGKSCKLKPAEIDRMASAFDHQDLRRVTRIAARPAVAKAPGKRGANKVHRNGMTVAALR
jgi:serine/threonine-protein kinase HipA